MPQIMYLKGMPKIDGSIRQAAWKFLEKLSENDTTPGLHIEPIQNAVDSKVRTGRVNLNFRAVMFRLTHADDTTYVLHGIWPHDEAIERAKRCTLTVNPYNGVAEVNEVDVASPSSPADQYVSAEPALPVGYLTSIGFVETDLTEGLGISPDIARRAMAADEDGLLVIADGAIEWQGLALLELASGKSVDYIRDLLELNSDRAVPEEPTDDEFREALDHPAARLQFAFIEDDEALRKVIEEGDLATWRTFLHPDQRRYTEISTSGPFRLSGGAGTGKTVVLLHRVRRLHRKNPEARIVLTTYSRTLADSLVENLKLLDPTLRVAKNLGDPGIVILGVDQLAAAVLKSTRASVDLADAVDVTLGSRPADFGGDLPDDAWKQAASEISEAPAVLKSPGFLASEYAMVVLPQRITSQEQYFKARRPGRGTALDRTRRAQVWQIVEAYRTAGAIGHWLDFAERAALASEILLRVGPKADHLLVDEGQDLSPSQWQMLRAMVASGPDDMFIAEDAHQRIFGQRVVLGRLGIAVVGRSRRLTLNYRTTAQNLEYAVRMLTGDTYVDGEELEESTEDYRSARSGPRPQLVQASSSSGELDRMAEVIAGWIEAGRRPGSIGVLVRTNQQRARVASALGERGIDARQVTSKSSGSSAGAVQIMTMHRVKGMEFECVLVFGIDSNSMPASWTLGDLDEAERADALQRERSLLYVSATRARDELAFVWNGAPSELLPV